VINIVKTNNMENLKATDNNLITFGENHGM
jgi:hypothetical protein